ncbi:MAG: C-type lectin domain-containing protein, partial [Opitutales bacterium]|nr:C-type lectin domain-containing protein [Opitutales bacterium]
MQQIIPSTTRERLPAEICSEFADIVSGVGNLEVLHACFGPKEGYRQTIFRTIRMHDGRKYNVSAYGQRSIFQEKIGMSVLGAAIDGELALLDSPARVLVQEEATGSGLSLDQTHVEISGERLSFDSREDAQSYCRRVRKMETTGGKVLNYDLFQASGQTLSTTSYQYQILDANLTWELAKFVAQGLGGNLAYIDDANESQTIANLIKNAGLASVWVGNAGQMAFYPNESNDTDHAVDYKLPYVVEFPLSSFANLSQDSNATGVKVLVIPARYKNQDTALTGSGKGNFSPQTSESIYKQMEATRTFYLRESNGRSRLDYNTT